MLRLIRETRFARALLLVTGILAVSASFGLHPEPVARSATLMTVPIWSANARQSPAPHECPACLTHRAVSITRLAAVLLVAESNVPAPVASEARRPDSLATRPHQGRAPPAVS